MSAKRLLAAVALLSLGLVSGSRAVFAQSPAEQFADAFKSGDSGKMREIVASNARELVPVFFVVLEEAANQLEKNRDQGQRYILFAAAMALDFSLLRGNRLYRDLADGSVLLQGQAQTIASDTTLATYLTTCLERNDTYTVAGELRSIVRAHERGSLPEPVRRLMDRVEKEKAERAQREAAAQERRRQAEEEERRRQYKQKIATLAARKDFAGLRKMYNAANAADGWDIYDALVATGDPTVAADLAKACIVRISDKDAGVSAQAEQTLRRVGTRAVPTILEQLKDNKNPDENLALARILGDIQTKPASPPEPVYLLLVQHKLGAIIKLGAIARPTILAVLHSKSASAIVDSLAVIGQLGSEADFAAVEPLISDSEPAVRKAAQRAMWQLASSFTGKLHAAASIAPTPLFIVLAALLSSIWWLPRLIRAVHPPFIDRLNRQTRDRSRENALAAACELVCARRRSLPRSAVHVIEDAARSGNPEMLLLLAWDENRRRNPQAAAARIADLWQACAHSVDAIWIAPRVCSVMAGCNAPPLSEVLRPFEEFVRVPHSAALARLIYGANDRASVLRGCEELAGLPPLPEEAKRKLEAYAAGRPACVIALLKDHVRQRQWIEAARLADLLERAAIADAAFPDWLLEDAIEALKADGAPEPQETVLSRMRSLRTVARYATAGDRESLRKAQADLATSAPLSPAQREALAARAAGHPAAEVMLGRDSIRAKRMEEATTVFEALERKARTGSAIPDWILEEAIRAIEDGGSPEPLKPVLQLLRLDFLVVRFIAKGGDFARRGFERGKAELAGGPIPIDIRQQLESFAVQQPESWVLLAADAMRRGKPEDSRAYMAALEKRLQSDPAIADWVISEVTRANVAGAVELQAASDRLKARQLLAAVLREREPNKPEALRKALRAFADLAPLQAEVRGEIEQSLPGHPELGVVLLNDDVRSARLPEAAVRAEKIAAQFLRDSRAPTWVLDETINLVRKSTGDGGGGAPVTHLLALARLARGLMSKAAQRDEIQSKLAAVRSELDAFGAPLPTEVRSALEKTAASWVEADIILAMDDGGSGAHRAALERVFRLMKRLDASHRAGTAAAQAWAYEAARADFAAQDQLRRAAEAGNQDAWSALALTVLQFGTAAPGGSAPETKVAHAAK